MDKTMYDKLRRKGELSGTTQMAPGPEGSVYVPDAVKAQRRSQMRRNGQMSPKRK